MPIESLRGSQSPIEGQNGHDRLFHVACVLVDGFGLSLEQAMPIFREWNQAKAKPPESDAQLKHKLTNAINKHRTPSLNLLHARQNRVNQLVGEIALDWPTLQPGAWVMACDRNPANFGQVLHDLGDSAEVHFVSPDGYPADVTLHKSVLRNMDGSELADEQSEEWPPLRIHEPPSVLPFPINVFPPSLQAYCREVAEAKLVPPDFVGELMLVVAGAAIGQSINVKVKRDWTEPPLLLLVLVAPPGRTKSPVIRTVVNPLTQIDRRLRDEFKKAYQAWLARSKAAKEGQSASPPCRNPLGGERSSKISRGSRS